LREGCEGCVAALPHFGQGQNEDCRSPKQPDPEGGTPKPKEMDIILNGIPEHIETTKVNITVDELLRFKKFSFKMLVVRINGELVRKEQYPTTAIANGDNVQVIHLISGG